MLTSGRRRGRRQRDGPFVINLLRRIFDFAAVDARDAVLCHGLVCRSWREAIVMYSHDMWRRLAIDAPRTILLEKVVALDYVAAYEVMLPTASIYDVRAALSEANPNARRTICEQLSPDQLVTCDPADVASWLLECDAIIDFSRGESLVPLLDSTRNAALLDFARRVLAEFAASSPTF